MKWEKGQSGNIDGRPKGAKNKLTLLKEERRAIFDEKISAKWDKIIDNLRAEYVADQFMGSAPTEMKITEQLNDDDKQKIADLEGKFNAFISRNGKETSA